MNAFVDPRAMLPEVTNHLSQNPVFAELSNRLSLIEGPTVGLEAEIERRTGMYVPGLTSSVDEGLTLIRLYHPDTHWAFGLQDVAYEGHTGPMAWLNNRQCQKVGFANDVNPQYRYFARQGRTLAGAVASLALWVDSYRN